MSNRTIHVFDGNVIADTEGNLVADDTLLKQLIARRDRDQRTRSKARELVEYETALRERRIEDEQYQFIIESPSGQPGASRRRRCRQHRSWCQSKRDMRRLAAELRAHRDNLTVAEVLASLNQDTAYENLCEGCIRRPDYCICHTKRHVLSGQAEEDVVDEYTAYQAYCREMILAGHTPTSFCNFVARGLGRPDELEPDWDYLEDFPETNRFVFATSSPFGTTFERYDASDYGRELNSRFADEY